MARSKRKQIDLTGLQDADSAPASWPDNIYPKKLTVTHDADMESDFSDLQLRDSDETTVLDHWIETYIADTEATVWVAVPLPSGSTSKSIYMYYDDPGAADSSDGSAVFDFFDDWSDRSVLAGTLSDNTSDPAIVNPRAIIQTPSGESRVREHSNTVLVDGTYDGTIAASPLVVHDGSTFHMLYESSPDDAGTYHTSYASSSDGINWTKSSNNPITTEMEVVDDFMVEGGTGYYTSHNVRDDGSGSISRLLSGPGDPANWETGTWTEIGPLGVSEGDSVMFIEGDTARVTYQPPDGSAIELFDWGGASPLRPYVLHMDLDDPNGLRQGVESGIYDITPHIVADTFSTGRVGGGVETANAEAYEESRIVSRFRLMGDPGRPGFLSVGSGDVIPADDNGTPIHYWPTFTDGYMIGVRTPDSSDGMVIAEISAGAHTTLDQTTLSSEDAQAWAVYETHIGQNGALAFVRDDVEELSASDTTHSPPHQVLIGHGGYQTHRVGYECDYVFVTKLVDSEPSVTFGTEEDTSGVETRSITTAQASATAGALTVDVAPQARSIASATAPASAATLTADPTPQTRSISAATALASTAENAR